MDRLDKLMKKQERQTKWMKITLLVIMAIIGGIFFFYIFLVGAYEFNLKEECLDICKQGGACAFTSNHYELFSCSQNQSDNCLNKCMETCSLI